MNYLQRLSAIVAMSPFVVPGTQAAELLRIATIQLFPMAFMLKGDEIVQQLSVVRRINRPLGP